LLLAYCTEKHSNIYVKVSNIVQSCKKTLIIQKISDIIFMGILYLNIAWDFILNIKEQYILNQTDIFCIGH
jgi:hypothetical protein